VIVVVVAWDCAASMMANSPPPAARGAAAARELPGLNPPGAAPSYAPVSWVNVMGGVVLHAPGPRCVDNRLQLDYGHPERSEGSLFRDASFRSA